jgi:hypothetical protein
MPFSNTIAPADVADARHNHSAAVIDLLTDLATSGGEELSALWCGESVRRNHLCDGTSERMAILNRGGPSSLNQIGQHKESVSTSRTTWLS